MIYPLQMNQHFYLRIEIGGRLDFCVCMTTGAVANLRGCGKEAAAVLFWVHIFAFFSMAGWIVLYIAILF